MRRLPFLFVSGLWDIGKCALVALVCVLAFLGALAVAEAIHDPHLPPIRPVSADARCAVRLSVPRRDTGSPAYRERLLQMDAAERYAEMKGALALLDLACPHVSSWVKGRYRSGHLVFETSERGRYAAWNFPFQCLIVNLAGLQESDLDLACTLAHEFRHSRQCEFQAVRVTIARRFGVDKRNTVEDEAYEFEGRIRRALQGEQP